MTILGVVLAGGESRRFGSDKAAAIWRGRPLIEHAIAALSRHVDAVAIAGRGWADVPTIVDWPSPGLGPLGGLNGALRFAAAQGHDHVLTIACDTPSLPADLLPILLDQTGAAAVAGAPVIGVWPVALAPTLDAWLRDNDDRSLRDWVAESGATLIAAPAIVNINRPEDLATLDN